jgi:hypothetical protein
MVFFSMVQQFTAKPFAAVLKRKILIHEDLGIVESPFLILCYANADIPELSQHITPVIGRFLPHRHGLLARLWPKRHILRESMHVIDLLRREAITFIKPIMTEGGPAPRHIGTMLLRNRIQFLAHHQWTQPLRFAELVGGTQYVIHQTTRCRGEGYKTGEQ